MQHHEQAQQLHSYRATYVPEGVPSDEVEFQADQGLLPTVQLKAPSSDCAKANAHRVTGRPIFSCARAPEVLA